MKKGKRNASLPHNIRYWAAIVVRLVPLAVFLFAFPDLWLEAGP